MLSHCKLDKMKTYHKKRHAIQQSICSVMKIECNIPRGFLKYQYGGKHSSLHSPLDFLILLAGGKDPDVLKLQTKLNRNKYYLSKFSCINSHTECNGFATLSTPMLKGCNHPLLNLLSIFTTVNNNVLALFCL